MAFENLHVGDFGIELRMRIVQNRIPQPIQDYSTLQMFLRHKQSGTTKTKTAAFLATGTDGYIYSTLSASDFDRAGDWQARARITKEGTRLTSAWIEFTVEA